MKDAPHIVWQASTCQDVDTLRNILAKDFSNLLLSATDLRTGINASQKAILVRYQRDITSIRGFRSR